MSTTTEATGAKLEPSTVANSPVVEAVSLESMTVAELKAVLQLRGINAKGTCAVFCAVSLLQVTSAFLGLRKAQMIEKLEEINAKTAIISDPPPSAIPTAQTQPTEASSTDPEETLPISSEHTPAPSDHSMPTSISIFPASSPPTPEDRDDQEDLKALTAAELRARLEGAGVQCKGSSSRI